MIILHLLLMFLKLREREIISFFIICNFVIMVRVNLVIHLVKHFYALLSFQISQIWGIKNEGLEIVITPPNPCPPSLKNIQTK